MAGERTEAPTPKKLRQARQRGQVSKSQDLAAMGVLLVAVYALRELGPGLWQDLETIVATHLVRQDTELTVETTMALGRQTGMDMLLALLPLFAVLSIAGIALNVGQTGLLFSGASLKPQFRRIDPFAGMKRLVGVEGWVNMAKAVAKMAVIALVVWFTMRGQLAQMAQMGQVSIPVATAQMGRLAFDIALRAAGVLFIIALLDYAWQRRRFLGQMRMTKEEVRQEFKESDGDPQIKAAIRRRRQQLLNRMMAAVPKADVVVTNPTHYAVALQYDPVTMGAPVVVAKGERLLALRIKELARKHGVPVLEEPPLARALYAACPVGSPIPANLFHAVAEVLAWVYALRAKMPPRRTPAGARP